VERQNQSNELAVNHPTLIKVTSQPLQRPLNNRSSLMLPGDTTTLADPIRRNIGCEEQGCRSVDTPGLDQMRPASRRFGSRFASGHDLAKGNPRNHKDFDWW
jgi:hypothetical protein